jgi:hypothetical protein
MESTDKHYTFVHDLNFILNYCTHFRLYLALCNDDSFVKECHNIILNGYNEKVLWLSFPSDNRFLFSFLENSIDSSKVTIVNGLKDNIDIDTVLTTMNVVREAFYKFKLPVILWVNDSIMGKFVKIAPDFYNCSGSITLK